MLNGAAVQCSNSLMNFSAFASYSPRDAVINSDGSFSALISLYPRLKWGLSDDSTLFHHPLTNAVNEATYGGHIDIFLLDGLRLGTTIYESLYDRVLNAEIDAILSTIIQDDSKFGDPGLADAEILAMYSSTGKSMLWEDAQSFRRVSGIDFTYILGAMILQGEYGELNKSKSIYHYGDEPAAWVLSSYFSFNKLNLLILYRDYDLDFDNAYQRSFYNYQRFKNTIFFYGYRLNDPIYSYLHLLNPQPQAEKGLFVQSRYEFHRNFLATRLIY